MKRRFDQLLAHWGQAAQWTPAEGETQQLRVFLQPVLKKREALPVTATALGAVSDQRWLCWSGAALAEGDLLLCGGEQLVVQEVQTLRLGDVIICRRAALRRRKEEA